MKILIVDDSLTARKVARSLLEGNGLHQIVEAQCANYALDILNQNKDFDLVITDINMPNLNGLDFARKVKQIKNLEHTHIVFMTTEATKKHFTEAIKLGATYFLRKPLQKEIFNSTINKVMHDIENKMVVLNHREKLEFLKNLPNSELSIDIMEDYISVEHKGVCMQIPINRAIFFKNE